MASLSVLDAFDSAKREFLSKYPDGSTYDFSSFPTIDHVYEAAQKIQQQQAKSRTMRNLNKIQPLLETLRHYGNVVDTFVQVKPDVLALIWAEKDRERDLEEYERQFEFRQLQEFEMVRNSLNARLYDQDLESLKRRASLGSGDWLEQHLTYQKWINMQDNSSKLLWLHGIPGAG
ncbi:hypothetical protein ACHAP8_009864 [Fusarium lateritium]